MQTKRLYAWIWGCLLSMLTLVLLTGCPAYHLRDAQDTFKTAATQEWLLKYGPAEDASAAALLGSANATDRSYQQALEIVTKVIEEDEKELKKDNLYGSAVLLRALCLWKTGASGTDLRHERLKINEGELSEEHAVILALVEEFAKVDAIHKAIATYRFGGTMPSAEYASYEMMFFDEGKIRDTFDRALDNNYVKNNKPLHGYLLIAQLTAYANYFEAHNSLGKDDRRRYAQDFEARKEGMEQYWAALLKVYPPESNKPILNAVRQMLDGRCDCKHENLPLP